MEKSESIKEKEYLNKENEKINKKSLISFPKLNKYYSILFICPVFCMLSNYFSLKLMAYNIIKNKYFFGVIVTELSHILAGLFYFLSYFWKNSNKVSNHKIKNGIKYSKNIFLNFNSKKVFIFLLLLSALHILNRFLAVFIYGKILFHHIFYYIL